MGGSIILHHLRGHWVPVPDTLDRYADAALITLAVLAVAVVVASVVKWRRGKHRADPVLRAAVDRLVEVEKLAVGGGPLTDRVAADEARLNQLQQSYVQLTDALREVFGEPDREQSRKSHLHVVKDGGEAV